jgi:glycosyltransferase involved in cell wall biosynthesis
MLENKSVAVVVPAYNEETQIRTVIESMPRFVDRIIVVNDCSADSTDKAVASFFGKAGSSRLPAPNKNIKENIYNKAELFIANMDKNEWSRFPDHEIVHPSDDEKIVLINLKKNAGVGSAIAIGYKWAKDKHIDCTAVMAGDGQMDPDELESICTPVIKGHADYVKGNRLTHKSAFHIIPRTRFLGNSILSLLTKIASGYWGVSDTQTGYTAISFSALNAIDLPSIYPRYGMPNDILVKLNIASCTMSEVGIKPIYHVGEKSKMKIRKVTWSISWLLLRSFFRRLYHKYLFRGFHPLFLLYHMGILLILLSLPYAYKLLKLMFAEQDANPLTAIAFFFLFISGFQSLLFAMWMDIQDNQRLHK